MSSTVTPTSTFVAADYTTNSNFMGWYIEETPVPVTCPLPQYYITSSWYAGCSQPYSLTAMPTSCYGNTLLYDDSSFDGPCNTGYSCSSYTIFPTEHAAQSDALWAFSCLSNWNLNSLYRTLPPEYAHATVSSVTSNPAVSPSHTATTHHTTSTSTSQDSGSGSGSSSDSGSGSGSGSGSSPKLSGGAIAGIVVGCAAAFIIAALLLIFRKKILACCDRGKPPVVDDGPTWSPVYVPPQTQSMAQTESTTIPPPSEMSSEQNGIHEIGSSNANSTTTYPTTVHEIG